MGTFTKFQILKNPQEEFLKIDHKAGFIKFCAKRYIFQDDDTDQYVCLIPSLGITGYGETVKKAKHMLKSAIDNFNSFIIDLPPHKLAQELTKMGWVRSKLRSKEYSKAFVDVNGALKGFNAKEKSLKLDLVAVE